MQQPLISIIIPVYNAEKYVAATIQSALNQTWINKEIIIINDGSTDDSLAAIKQFDNDMIKVYTQVNHGAGTARNRGLQQASGTYIQFLDADDLLSPNKIEVQMALIGDSQDYIGLCGSIHFTDGTDPVNYDLQHEWVSCGSDDPVDFLIKLYGGDLIGPEYGGMIQPNAWLTPKTLIDKAGPWGEIRNPDDDGEYFCRVVLASKGIRYANDAINYYRKFNSHNSLSAQKYYDACDAILKSTKLKAKYLLAKTTDSRAKKVLSRLFWENAFSFYPYYKDLVIDAQENAEALAPGFIFNPYRGVNKLLSQILGWKKVKYLQHIKQKISQNYGNR